jgi:hypothetical protein
MDQSGIDYRDTDVIERRAVIVASPERAAELLGSLKWDPAKDGKPPLASATDSAFLFFLPEILTMVAGGPVIAAAYYAGRYLGLKKPSMPTKFPYPLFDLKRARDQLKFPTNYPIDGLVYACCDAEPVHYVPLASFHRYMYEMKMGAFQKLCSNLGAKSCYVLYAEEDGRDVTAKFRAAGVPTQEGPASGGTEGGVHERSSANVSVFVRFPPPDRPLEHTESGWMNSEPTWRMMQEIRLGRGTDGWDADFNYTDDMGVTAEIAARILGMGLQIGGKYEEIHRRKWKFNVEF